MKSPSTRRAQVWLVRLASASLGLGLWPARLDAQVLPPAPTASAGAAPVPGAVRVFVRGFQFEGNTAFSDAELTEVVAPFTNRELGSDGLEAARRAVTLHYVNAGYVNSGAVLPDQDLADGRVTLRVVEGVLTGIDVHGNKWLRDRVITGGLWRRAKPPLDLNELQDGLALLRQNPNVRQINAELKPGAVPGESQLDLRVTDQHPFRLGVQFDNQRPPSVGAEEVLLLASDLNLTGHSDVLDLSYGIANSGADGPEFSGLDNMQGSYALPLTRWGTTVGLHASRLDTAIVEESFTALDITSVTTSYGVSLRQPLYQTSRQEFALGLGFDRRSNDSWLLDEPFNLSPGAIDGEMVVSVLRFSQEWVWRGADHVLALRSTLNWGLDEFGATDNGVIGDPDATYISWLGQAQYVRRLFQTQNQLLLRLSGQWTPDPLLALEQIAVGGLETVRGYRENQLVRDRGLIASAECRVPVLFNKAGAGIVHLAPFFDFGGGWNIERSPSPTTICSTGVGLLLAPSKHVAAQLYWGYRLREVDIPDDEDPQDLGLHFTITIHAF